MAESTSPSLSRSSHKLLEYTSCIDTTVSSPTTISTRGNINAHSSFDFISQPRDCDTLVNRNENNHRILERDRRRLDIDSNKHIIELNNKKLGPTESISLPSTPIEHLSSKCDRKYNPLLLAQANNNQSDDDEDNEVQRFRFTSSTDYMLATSEQMTDESISNSKR
jgi:hypothetical protein